MGRTLWGATYDCGQPRIRNAILSFAVQKLLCVPDDNSGRPFLTTGQEALFCRSAAVDFKSEALALDINSTVYVSNDSKRNYDMADKALLQRANLVSRFCRYA